MSDELVQRDSESIIEFFAYESVGRAVTHFANDESYKAWHDDAKRVGGTWFINADGAMELENPNKG